MISEAACFCYRPPLLLKSGELELVKKNITTRVKNFQPLSYFAEKKHSNSEIKGRENVVKAQALHYHAEAAVMHLPSIGFFLAANHIWLSDSR